MAQPIFIAGKLCAVSWSRANGIRKFIARMTEMICGDAL
jgi:hypothetical protein